jgi:beta-glucosidase
VVNQAYHHALLCHGHGVRAVREHGRRGSQVGLVDNPIVTVPLDLGAENVAAAKRAFAAANIRVLDPIHRGGYAESYLRSAGRSAPKAARGDFGLISLTADFLGLNIYTGHFVRRGARGLPEKVPFPEGFPRADCEWLQLLPQSLYWGPRFACELYRPPAVFITENGAGFEEPASVKGEFPDLHRREYVRDCLRELHGAIREGLPVKGYFLWSILDNFEWEDGYDKRFGIVHVDFKTQKRTPKLSARWYAKVIRRGHLI